MSRYEAVFGQKYHRQLKCNMSDMRQCRSIFQRLKLSVRQHDIVNIEIDDAEFDYKDNANDSDDEGLDIDDHVFPDCISEEDDMQLGEKYSCDGMGETQMFYGDGDDNDGECDDDDGELYYEELPSTPPVVVNSTTIICQLTYDSPPPMVNEDTKPATFHASEYLTFSVQEA